MRLLSPQEQKDVEEKEGAQKKKKLIELNEALTAATKSLNEFNQKALDERTKVLKDHAEFKGDLEGEITNLQLKVASLENRKKEALKPISKRKKELDMREKALDGFERNLLNKEASFQVFKDKVHELASNNDKRSGELADLEGYLKSREDKLKEDTWRFNAMMKYKESAIKNDRDKLRKYFEEESRKIKQNK